VNEPVYVIVLGFYRPSKTILMEVPVDVYDELENKEVNVTATGLVAVTAQGE
jgi:hypothetical protein